MPSYDFRCEACGDSFTVTVSIKEKDAIRCPSCGAGKPRQLFHAIGVIKGSGGGSASGGGCTAPAGSGFS